MGKLKFEGEYKNGKKWNARVYDGKWNIKYKLNNGNGKVKKFNQQSKLIFEENYI